MTRWCTETSYVTADRDSLQRVTVYPTKDNKQRVKAENGAYNYTRFCLIPEKDNRGERYSIAKMGRAGKGN